MTEATNAELELFGDDRLLQALNQDPQANPQTQISHVHEAIGAFVKEAPQFDDITMLCMEYKGSARGQEKEYKELKVPAKVESLGEVTEFAEKQLEAVECDPDIMFNITLAVEEVFANVANYAYDGGEGDMTLTFSYDEAARQAEFIFRDNGIPFDPTHAAEPDITKRPQDRKIGGLGIHIVRKTMDEVEYAYTAGQNILTLRQHIKSDSV